MDKHRRPVNKQNKLICEGKLVLAMYADEAYY